MPKEQNVVGKDFDKRGPRDGHFCPETYMDVPILTRGLISVRMSFQWEDQVCCCFYPDIIIDNFMLNNLNLIIHVVFL